MLKASFLVLLEEKLEINENWLDEAVGQLIEVAYHIRDCAGCEYCAAEGTWFA